MASSPPDVLIVGAGVIGLTTGLRLAERGWQVRIRAEQWGRETSSAAAGAIFDPTYATHPRVPQWSGQTYDEFARLAKDGHPAVRMVEGVEAARASVPPPDWAGHLPGFRLCTQSELPRGFVSGWRFTAPIVDMPSYLRWLEHELRAAGSELLPGRLQTIEDGFADADIVVNCSGIGARELVPDPEMQPVRGQLVAVRNPGIREFFGVYADELGDMTYFLPQGDVLLLGGNAEEGEQEPAPDRRVAAEIIRRCSEIFPAIAGAEVLEHRTGIRPLRREIRLEHTDLGDRHIVHNYGHSGAGVSLSWGCADDVAELVQRLRG